MRRGATPSNGTYTDNLRDVIIFRMIPDVRPPHWPQTYAHKITVELLDWSLRPQTTIRKRSRSHCTRQQTQGYIPCRGSYPNFISNTTLCLSVCLSLSLFFLFIFRLLCNSRDECIFVSLLTLYFTTNMVCFFFLLRRRIVIFFVCVFFFGGSRDSFGCGIYGYWNTEWHGRVLFNNCHIKIICEWSANRMDRHTCIDAHNTTNDLSLPTTKPTHDQLLSTHFFFSPNKLSSATNLFQICQNYICFFFSLQSHLSFIQYISIVLRFFFCLPW